MKKPKFKEVSDICVCGNKTTGIISKEMDRLIGCQCIVKNIGLVFIVDYSKDYVRCVKSEYLFMVEYNDILGIVEDSMKLLITTNGSRYTASEFGDCKLLKIKNNKLVL